AVLELLDTGLDDREDVAVMGVPAEPVRDETRAQQVDVRQRRMPVVVRHLGPHAGHPSRRLSGRDGASAVRRTGPPLLPGGPPAAPYYGRPPPPCLTGGLRRRVPSGAWNVAIRCLWGRLRHSRSPRPERRPPEPAEAEPIAGPASSADRKSVASRSEAAPGADPPARGRPARTAAARVGRPHMHDQGVDPPGELRVQIPSPQALGTLDEARAAIDGLDAALATLLEHRAAVAAAV